MAKQEEQNEESQNPQLVPLNLFTNGIGLWEVDGDRNKPIAVFAEDQAELAEAVKEQVFNNNVILAPCLYEHKNIVSRASVRETRDYAIGLIKEVIGK